MPCLSVRKTPSEMIKGGVLLLLFRLLSLWVCFELNGKYDLALLLVLQEPEWLSSGLDLLVSVLAKEALKSPSTPSCAPSGQCTHDRLMNPHAMTGEKLLTTLLDLSTDVVSEL